MGTFSILSLVALEATSSSYFADSSSSSLGGSYYMSAMEIVDRHKYQIHKDLKASGNLSPTDAGNGSAFLSSDLGNGLIPLGFT